MTRLLALPVVLGLLAQAACGNESNTGEACNLLPGDLVISEVMANPFLNPDSGNEWFEIYNASSQPQVLDRLVLQRLFVSVDDVTGAETVEAKEHVVRGAGSVGPGAYFVFGDGVPGIKPIDYSYENGAETFGDLNNSSGGVGLRCKDRVVDEIWYSDVVSANLPEIEEGRSISFDGGVTPDALRNDDGELWCSGGSVYDGLNQGSPGETNIACGFGACDDGGTMRDVVQPGVGDLIVSEVFGDATDNDTNREWIEIYVAGANPVDINGLELAIVRSTTREAQVTELRCVRGNPGDYLVVGGSSDPLVNGGVTVDAVATGLDRTDGMLFNSGGTVTLERGRTVIDTAEVPEFTEGASMGLDPLEMTAAANDLLTNFCNGQSTGQFDELGTPGAANDPCGSACLDGGVLRLTNPPTTGKLVVTEVYPDPATPGTDSDREWVEVFVTPGGNVDLNGLVVELQRPAATSVERTVTVDAVDCITVPGATYVVIGGVLASGDGVPVDVIMAGDDLYNETCGLTLRSGATLIDAITYEDPGSGVSWSLHPGIAEGASPDVANNVASNWCISTDTVGGFTGTGSPGISNTTACF